MRIKPQALRSVSDTALLVAYHRAIESQRPDALFKDEFAIKLTEARGEQIARSLFYSRSMAWSTVVRTVLIDDIVQRVVADGVGSVINLAAGLDARPYRLPLPESLRWAEIDLPDVVREKNEALAAETPVCRLERIALDLTDAEQRRQLFGRLAGESQDALILSEGLLMYLPPAVVGELADDLHAHSAFRRWATDLATPAVKQRIERWWGRKLRRAQTHYQFAPAEGTKFFEPHGWREAEFHPMIDHGIRLNRAMRGAWILKAMARVAPKRAARMREKWRIGVVLLDRMH